MKSFKINLQKESSGKDYSIIELSGFLDAHTVNSFENSVAEILQGGNPRLVIELRELNYISSAGIGALMALTQSLRKKNGDLVLLQPNKKVYKILDLLGFTKIFNVAMNENEINGLFKQREDLGDSK